VGGANFESPRTGVADLTLNDLKPGEHGRVRGCDGDGALVQRLCEMGFVPGVPLRVVRYAPLGDPMQVELYGYHVSLRKSEASLVRVERLAALEPACGRR
jgi:Fe2+ transport system protein FeoA